jgi:YD repeat-containing protein
VAAGNDQVNTQAGTCGWRFTSQNYDWKGRLTLTLNTDGSSRQVSYQGCGCAGNDDVTETDENGRRKTTTHDALGRVWKTAILNWDSATYATTVNTYNVRDQITSIKHYQGAETSPTLQESSMAYDGLGRLIWRKDPEQSNGTIYSYYNDGLVQQVMDARGVATNFRYNSRHLLTEITYPDQSHLPMGFATTPNVTFDYDAAGNRLWMNENGQRSVTYHYDTLSRIDWEERTFTGVRTSRLLNWMHLRLMERTQCI